jgi:hypothetical protein
MWSDFSKYTERTKKLYTQNNIPPHNHVFGIFFNWVII